MDTVIPKLEQWQILYVRIQQARMEKQHLYLDDDEVHLLYDYLEDPQTLTNQPRRARVE